MYQSVGYRIRYRRMDGKYLESLELRCRSVTVRTRRSIVQHAVEDFFQECEIFLIFPKQITRTGDRVR